MLEKIAHTCIAVNDMERSIAFYRDVVGCEVGTAQEFKDSTCVPLKIGADMLELMKLRDPDGSVLQRPPDPNDRGTVHICFRVNDIEEHARKVKESGASVTKELFDLTLGNGSVIRCFYFRDPDGYQLQYLAMV